MKFMLKVVAAGAIFCLCRYAIEKYASFVLVKETESYLESVYT